MAKEMLSDALIGVLSQAEKKLLLDKLGAGHWVNNVMGSPSTWLRRYNWLTGSDIPEYKALAVEQLQYELDRAAEVDQEVEKFMRKLQ